MQVSFILFHIPCYVAHSLPHSALHSQSKSRYLGANSPGYTNPRDGVRMGIAPAAAATAGRIGIAARSGTLSYEATGATSELGLGQSYILGLGGDFYPGTRTDGMCRSLTGTVSLHKPHV
jgi:succinyl-CoA synthetase alpha subunit